MYDALNFCSVSFSARLEGSVMSVFELRIPGAYPWLPLQYATRSICDTTWLGCMLVNCRARPRIKFAALNFTPG